MINSGAWACIHACTIFIINMGIACAECGVTCGAWGTWDKDKDQGVGVGAGVGMDGAWSGAVAVAVANNNLPTETRGLCGVWRCPEFAA